MTDGRLTGIDFQREVTDGRTNARGISAAVATHTENGSMKPVEEYKSIGPVTYASVIIGFAIHRGG